MVDMFFINQSEDKVCHKSPSIYQWIDLRENLQESIDLGKL